MELDCGVQKRVRCWNRDVKLKQYRWGGRWAEGDGLKRGNRERNSVQTDLNHGERGMNDFWKLGKFKAQKFRFRCGLLRLMGRKIIQLISTCTIANKGQGQSSGAWIIELCAPAFLRVSWGPDEGTSNGLIKPCVGESTKNKAMAQACIRE